ncbi:uncharacterized protein LOC110837681 [Zootermopsis nevadensis]|nr:uncharacterized protein LOC110837681 [Zootermopsis nevadensis]
MTLRRHAEQEDTGSNCDHAFNETTETGHVVGLLDRDQRTALSRAKFDDMRAVFVSQPSSPRCSCNGTTARRPNLQPQISRTRSHKIKRHLVRRTLHRFHEALFVCACLLTLIRVPSAMSAPTSRHGSLDQERMNSHPKWINPCGLGASDDFDSELDSVPRLSDNELLSSIIVAAKGALMHAERFKENYVKNTFNENFRKFHQEWKSTRYEWLPTTEQISKNLGEPIPIEQLQKLELDVALKDTFAYLQKFAVGMEQIVWDQIDNNGAYKDQFADIEFRLRATLCEIQAAMLERGVMQYENVTRQIMANELRHMGNSSYRNMRDWVIFRDCMNGLEYVIQVFEYLQQKLTS